MGLVPTTRSVGVTVKFVIEADEDVTQRLLDSLPSELKIGGTDLSALRIGVGGLEVEPARIWVSREGVSIEKEDEFLEST